MAKPTEAQLKGLEIAHKQHLISLIRTALFRIGVAEKYGLNSAEFFKYNYIFNNSLKKWIDREIRLSNKSHKGTLPHWIYEYHGGNWMQLFNTREGVVVLQKLAKEIDQEGLGIENYNN